MACNNKGQALVEFVLILPIFIFLVFLSVDIGRIIYAKNHLESELNETVTLLEDKKSYEYIGYTFYKKDIYDMFMKLLNKKNPCEFPTFIATKYLKYVAVDMAVKNKDFSLFKQLYNDLYTDIIKL